MTTLNLAAFIREAAGANKINIVKGHRCDVLATRIVGGKEEVYAKATMTLK